MPKPTQDELYGLLCRNGRGDDSAAARVATELNAYWSARWDADEAERERGEAALALLELYARHKPTCSLYGGYHPCDCGFADAMGGFREEPSSKVQPPPEGWEATELEQVEQYNAAQRAKAEGYARAVAEAGTPAEVANKRAAARYPLKKRVPATLSDLRSPTLLWRWNGDTLEWQYEDGDWHLDGYPSLTRQRFRAIAALLDRSWAYEDDASVEGEAT